MIAVPSKPAVSQLSLGAQEKEPITQTQELSTAQEVTAGVGAGAYELGQSAVALGSSAASAAAPVAAKAAELGSEALHVAGAVGANAYAAGACQFGLSANLFQTNVLVRFLLRPY
jgi:hypothetical protein